MARSNSSRPMPGARTTILGVGVERMRSSGMISDPCSSSPGGKGADSRRLAPGTAE